MQLWKVAAACWLVWAAEAEAVVIDSFTAGPLARGPETTEIVVGQTGLPASDVLGGGRDWFVQYGGSLEVDTASGELTLDHDRGIFEVAQLSYGPANIASPAAALNADFTAGGHRQITLRMSRSASFEPAAEVFPAYILISVRSGVEGANHAGGSFAVRPIFSDDAYLLQMPFERFATAQRPIDFSDIDSINVSFSFQGLASVTIDEIFTSAGLPGDYNLDGNVNAADYTVWRNHFGSNVTLANENPAAATPGFVDHEDYEFWTSRYGGVFPEVGSAVGTGFPAPEPSFLVVGLAGVVASATARRRW